MTGGPGVKRLSCVVRSTATCLDCSVIEDGGNIAGVDTSSAAWLATEAEHGHRLRHHLRSDAQGGTAPAARLHSACSGRDVRLLLEMRAGRRVAGGDQLEQQAVLTAYAAA